MILSVGEHVWVNSDLTNSVVNLESAIEGVGSRKNQTLGDPCQGGRTRITRGRRMRLRYPCGGTMLWNAVYYASKLKMQVTGPKALLILSDGWTPAAITSGRRDRSGPIRQDRGLHDQIRGSCALSTFHPDRRIETRHADAQRENRRCRLRAFARESGRCLPANRRRIAATIRADVHAEQRGARWHLPQAVDRGEWTGPALQVQARKGYRAPAD